MLQRIYVYLNNKLLLSFLLWCAFTWILRYYYNERASNECRKFKNEITSATWAVETWPDKQMSERLQRESPFVAFLYWQANAQQKMRFNETCAYLPDPITLEYHNSYWQTLRQDNLIYRLYGAYYDNRASVLAMPFYGGPMVRVISMLNCPCGPMPRLFCQLWWANSTAPTIVEPIEVFLLFNTMWVSVLRSSTMLPYMISCPVPASHRHRVPQTVSLVSDACANATNNLRIHYEPRPAEQTALYDVGICLKNLNYPYADISVRLVEWLELQGLLGVHKIFAYHLRSLANVRRVLAHYEARDFLELQPYILTNDVSGRLRHYQNHVLVYKPADKRYNEQVVYNDCFYRHMYRYRYLALIDLDEVLMPQQNLTTMQHLLEVMANFEAQSAEECPHGHAAFCFRNFFFPTNAKGAGTVQDGGAKSLIDYMPLLKHNVSLSDNTYTRLLDQLKCLHSTAEVLSVHNHMPLRKLRSCAPVVMRPHRGRLQHYKPVQGLNPTNLTADGSVWRYKAALLARTQQVLTNLGLLLS